MRLSAGNVRWELELASNGRFLAHSLAHSSDLPPLSASQIGLEEVLPELLEELLGCSHRSCEVYSGHAGVSLVLYLLSRHDSVRFNRNTCALHFDKLRPNEFSSHAYTFMCGRGGYYALRAVLFPSDHSAEELQRIGRAEVLPSPREDCELLYGRAGFLYCLFFVRRALNSPEMFSDLVIELVRQIVNAGQWTKVHLMWSWHGKRYLGAAHGVAGIVYVLLCCSPKELAHLRGIHILPLLESTVDNVLANHSIMTSGSRNVKSLTGSKSDMLVHFCHGATGWVPALLKLWLIPGKDKYLDSAVECGETVWEGGLLATKGPGICHGIGGSICAMIDLFTATQHSLWLERSKYFSLALVRLLPELTPHADSPRPLMEGRAGALYALGLVSLILSGKYASQSPPTEDWQTCFPGLGL